MDAVKADIMKELDLFTCKNITPSIELMERAGKEIERRIVDKYHPKKVLLLCGSSGNGGDAFVIGRYLISDGVFVDAYSLQQEFKGDCKINKDLFKGNIISSLNAFDYDLIVDGLIGIGLKNRLKDNYIDLINKVNESNIDIVSIDIPTGIDATNGISYGAFIKAKTLYTIEYPKTGLFLNDGLDSYDDLEIVPIGIIKTEEVIHVNEVSDFKNILKKRKRNSNKGSFGKASIVAGSYKYPGASYISYMALAQFKMGVGYSFLYIPKSLYDIYALRHPEVIVSTFSDDSSHIKYDEEFLNGLLNMDSISLGMGMDVSEDLYLSIKYLLNNYTGNLVLDADALNTVSKYGVEILKNKKCNLILTPHLKEMERLCKIDLNQIKENPFDIALSFAKEYEITLVLKSSSTIITNGFDLAISSFGNSSLAKGGSGDTLAGILSGLLAYLDTDIFKICNFATYVLGKSATLASLKIEEECMSPLDIINEINNVFKEIKNE